MSVCVSCVLLYHRIAFPGGVAQLEGGRRRRGKGGGGGGVAKKILRLVWRHVFQVAYSWRSRIMRNCAHIKRPLLVGDSARVEDCTILGILDCAIRVEAKLKHTRSGVGSEACSVGW